MNTGAKISLSGKIDILEVVNKDGSIHNKIEPKSTNMILDCGLDYIATYNLIGADGKFGNLLYYFAIGTGTDFPSATDTLLGNETTYVGVSRLSSSGYTGYNLLTIPPVGSNPFVCTVSQGIQTNVGAISGTFTELGFSPNYTRNTPLFSKFRIVDSEGNPTSVTVSSEQQLRLKYTISIQFLPNSYETYTTNISGIGDSLEYSAGWQKINDTTTLYAASKISNSMDYFSIGNYSTLAEIGSAGVMSNSFITPTHGTITYETYTSGTYYRYINIEFNANSAAQSNDGIGIGSPYMVWSAKFTSPIVKDNIHKLKFRIKVSWGRI